MKPFYRCNNATTVEKGNSATMGGVLFSTGLVGNLLALGLLARSGLGSCPPRPQRPLSVFYVLVCGLTITDLLGKSLVSPFVLAAYAQNRSLQGLAPESSSSLCHTFAFFMTFFGLASTLQLLAMALECWLSLGHPFFYRRHFTLRRGALVAPAVGSFCLAFCALPFAGFGQFVQYCPGTWCFIQMVHDERSLSVLGYSVLYASLIALLVLAIVLCNVSAMRNLYSMHRRLQRSQRCTRDRAEPEGERDVSPQPLEELDHLLLLALMTVLFTVCSLPLIVPDASRMRPDFPGQTTPPMCPGALLTWRSASPEPLPNTERERQAGSLDQPVNADVQQGTNYRSQTFHHLYPTRTLGPYSQRVKE
ncbi:prostaglandin D2 receptor isoform X1 [Erinaceus europaeus]|uniref:Prostaglandin D2 receptor isoform X1 n=1 Tax=Erinaceus europaeus TaxID=9365 RepID=A0ABM3W2Z0_ERIEU|nr:prostaglandin D2 receptor isoform X1 [Erinaceus europaeus]